MQIAVVLWSGETGGTETFSAALCNELRKRGIDAGIVLVTTAGPLGARLELDGVPYVALGYRRGSHVIGKPRELARAVRDLGSDGAITPSPGYLPAAMRAGGYRGRLVAVNHGRLLQAHTFDLAERTKRRLDRLSGSWACDVEVAVSDFMLERLRAERFRARRLVRIYNGLDLSRFAMNGAEASQDGLLRVSWAGRMIAGKGVDDLLRAVAALTGEVDIRLRLAGDGPERGSLEALADELGVRGRIEFAGWVRDVPSFWRSADVAVVPSHQFVESFGMAALEAMACGRPVVVSQNGGLPEVVEMGTTGDVFAPGDVTALATALRSYAADDTRRRLHGEQGRARAARLFGIERAADSYLELLSVG